MTGFLGVAGVLLSLSSVAPQVVSEAPALIVATPTYGSDGSKFGAQTPFRLTLGQTQVMFASAGSTLCESRSAGPSNQSGSGQGWRLEVSPRELTAEGVLVVNVAWQRLVPDGAARDGNVVLRLPAGGRVQLDYIGAAVKPPCQAIGMALELARPPRPATGLYEVETWLVPGVSGESMQHQVLRLRPGDSGTFYFDDVAVPEGKRLARIQGTVVVGGRSDTGFDSEVTIRRYDVDAGASRSSGSTTYPLKAGFGEVVEFRVPMGSFSLRVRAREIR